jgi:hypothetical protein
MKFPHLRPARPAPPVLEWLQDSQNAEPNIDMEEHHMEVQQNPVPVVMQKNVEEAVSVGEWFVTMLILAIPIANIIMIFVWAFGGGAKKSKSNYFKAMLIWAVIGIVLSIVFFILLGSWFTAFWKQFGGSMTF